MENSKLNQYLEKWKLVKIGEIGEIVTGTTPSTKKEEFWGKGIPFVTPTDFKGQVYIYKTERSITKLGAREGRIIPRNSIMVVCIASVGEIAIAYTDSITNQQINSIICKPTVNPHYVYYALLFRKNILKAWAGVTTTPIIKKSLFEKFPIPLPPLPEQKKIAEILSTVDEAIEVTDREIEKAERLKRGLMQELLTKGIGHARFKKTEVGVIPEGWKIVRLEEVSNIIMGQSPPGSTYNDKKGMPFLQGKTEFGTIYPTHEKYTTKPIKIAPIGSVLLSVRAPVGAVNIAKVKYCIGRGLASINLKRGNNIFLFYLLGHSKPKIEKIGTGSTFKAITKGMLESFKLPLPPLPEQRKIAEILSSADDFIESLRVRREKLVKLKQGLMEDLLTGKRRVKV